MQIVSLGHSTYLCAPLTTPWYTDDILGNPSFSLYDEIHIQVHLHVHVLRAAEPRPDSYKY